MIFLVVDYNWIYTYFYRKRKPHQRKNHHHQQEVESKQHWLISLKRNKIDITVSVTKVLYIDEFKFTISWGMLTVDIQTIIAYTCCILNISTV